MNRKRIKARAIAFTDGRRMLLAAVMVAILLALLAILAIPASAKSDQTFPPVFNVPDGWQPEGIAVGRGSSFYVGSLLTGAIYGGDLRTGEGAEVVPPQEGRIAVGLDVDERSNNIFVAGGGPLLGPIPGSAYVYDAETGAELAEYPLNGVFINDVVVTEATPNGKWLILANTGFASLYKVDPLTGEATKIDLGGVEVPNGDGLVLAGKTLYVVQNFSNQIGKVHLDPTFTSGTVSIEPLTSPDFRIPTTAAKFGSTIYAVNARFGDFTPGVPSPALEFTVVGLPMR
jgi:hypothetical protein